MSWKRFRLARRETDGRMIARHGFAKGVKSSDASGQRVLYEVPPKRLDQGKAPPIAPASLFAVSSEFSTTFNAFNCPQHGHDANTPYTENSREQLSQVTSVSSWRSR